LSSAPPGGEAFAQLGMRMAQVIARLQQARTVTVGCSAKQAVWRHGKTTLYRYEPLSSAPPAQALRPLLICFALVNRPYVLDLQPDRSLVRRLLEAGLPVYLIDWGEPDEGDRRTDLAEYIEEHLGGCVRYLLSAHGIEALDLMGVCQGGVLSLCYCALHPGTVARLVTLTTPVDFHTPDNLLSKWVRDLDTSLIEATGNVPGELLNALFLALMPVRLTQQKYVRLLAGDADERAIEDFVRMEKWIFDSPPQAARALAQFVRWFYQENRLLAGTLSLGGRPVRLTDIRMPVLNLYALEDHIVPPTASAVLGQHLRTSDYSDFAVATGHIGMYVSRAAREEIPQRISAWLKAADNGGRRRPRRRSR
jgi:polyhydroxyalkanoate synthase subunit PhaC